jgi:hypothetical protein
VAMSVPDCSGVCCATSGWSVASPGNENFNSSLRAEEGKTESLYVCVNLCPAIRETEGEVQKTPAS